MKTLLALVAFVKLQVLNWRWKKALRQARQIVRECNQSYPGCRDAMNMAWPATSGTTTGYTATGVTTIRWGTDGVLQSPKPSSGYYVVLRCNERVLAERIPLPNGTGISSSRIMLIDGHQWDITVRDDSQMTAPSVNGTISIVDMAGFIGTVGLKYTATVIDANYEAALKQPGERVLTVESLLLVDSQTSGSQV